MKEITRESLFEVSVGDLIPYQNNANKGDVNKVAASLEAFGYVKTSCGVDEEMILLYGHTTLKAIRKLGWESVPEVTQISGLTESEKMAYRLMDNKAGRDAEWDPDLLLQELSKLRMDGFDLTLTGFEEKEFVQFLAEKNKKNEIRDSEPQIDRAAALRKSWKTAPGQIWKLGPHRVICGDSTDKAVVKRLFGKQNPGILVTDPPYGVEYDPEWRLRAGINKEHQTRAEGKVNNDDRASWQAAYDLFPGDVAYVWHAGVGSPTVAGDLIASGFELRNLIIWAKPSLVISRGHYHHQHEPCWYGVRKGATAQWCGDRKQSTLWEFPNMHRTQGCVDDGKTCHSTQKPIGYMLRPLQNHGHEIVYDMFLGSGTTLMAAENAGRICLGVEIDPGYVAVILQRYQDATKKDPVLMK